MSHAKGLLGSCPGKWTNYGRAVSGDGRRQQRCSRCGRVRWHRVRSCWPAWRHKWVKSGQPRFGTQKVRCTKCGDTGETQVRRCWFGLHQFSARHQKCKRCGEPRVTEERE
jgi:hypothetical protein